MDRAGRAAEFRAKAEQCRKLAETVTDNALRTHLLAIAEAWEKLATDTEQGLFDGPASSCVTGSAPTTSPAAIEFKLLGGGGR